MSSLPTRNDPPNMRRAKKKLNTWFLDNQWCIPKGKCALTIYIFAIFFTMYLLFGYISLTSQLGEEIIELKGESELLREQMQREIIEKQKLEQQLKEIELSVKSKERVINQKEQQISLKATTIEDLKLGLQIFEDRVKQLEQTLKYQPPTIIVPPEIVPAQPEINVNTNNQQINANNDNLNIIKEENKEEKKEEKKDEIINTNVIQNTNFEKAEEPIHPQIEIETQPPVPIEKTNVNKNGGFEDTEKKEAVKRAFLHAWNSYKEYAWGMDELKPTSKGKYNWLGLGVTIIDALDTIWIMGLEDEFKLARDWVAENLNFDRDIDISVFETTIRELGGLLSAYELSRDKVFLDKAENLAFRLLPAFNTKTGIPNASINLKTMESKPLSWTGGASILSEIGTLQLEFLYLAYHTNKPNYAIKALDVFKHLDSLEKDRGLYNLYIDVSTGNMKGKEISLGALGDSFYEYMLKLWLFTDKQFEGYSRMYRESSVGIKDVLVQTTKSGYRYVDQIGRSGTREKRMEHLACFSGGMFALGSYHNIDEDMKSDDIKLGADITESCHESYTRTQTKIGPEYFEFSDNRDFIVPSRAKHYLLRPETVESYFIMWRTTHEQKYRDWAWEAFQAIEKHCRLESGYSGLLDVDSLNGGHDDLQQSFFLAETLKYLYLIFTDDDVISLDKYVFNTEAHPFGIINDPIDTYPQELRFHMIEF